MFNRRQFALMMLVGAGLALSGLNARRLLAGHRAFDPIDIGDGLVIIDGWVLRADEAAALRA